MKIIQGQGKSDMGGTYLCIAALALLILLLEIIKLCGEKKSGAYLDVGTCMTIGSREVQEDQLASVQTDAGMMAVLADGAGRTYGGRIAARTAVDVFRELFGDYNAFNNPQYYFRKAFQCANREILKTLGDEDRGFASAGCALIRGGYLYYALVGNVKVAVFREGTLVPVSLGHTVAVMAERSFREGRISRQETLALLENQKLYNYLGRDGFRDIEFFDAPVRLRKGDIVVLMSDGVYELLGFREVEETLAQRSDCQKKALRIIEKVNQNAAENKDNASVVLIGVTG